MANEKRLIDANELKRRVLAFATSVKRDFLSVDAIIDRIDTNPTVDAVEVVHGRWQSVDHDGSWRVDMCSICHRRMHYVDYDQPYQYCPNCGAKMDGGKADEADSV